MSDPGGCREVEAEGQAVYNFSLRKAVRARFMTAVWVLATTTLAVWVCTPRPQAAAPTPGTSHPVTVTADLDGGGALDTAVLRGDEVAVSLSERNITIDLRALAETTALAVGDIDHDGDLDLVSLGRDGVRTWINHGSGSFTASTVVLSQKPMLPLDMQAVRWSGLGSVLPPMITSRAPLDGLVPSPTAAVAPFIRAGAVAIIAGRAPPRIGLSCSSPRAPPQSLLA
jgi:FlaG/FlaF family flagellin (archaellin)